MKAHGDTRKGKLANGVGSQYPSHHISSSIFTLPRNTVYSAFIPLMHTPRLPVVDWTETCANSNGLIHFVERRNLVPVHVPSHFKCSLPNMNKNVWNFPFTLCAGENICGKYDTETVYLTCILLDFWTLHLHFGSSFPLLGCQKETETVVWSGGQDCQKNTSDRKEDPHNLQLAT